MTDSAISMSPVPPRPFPWRRLGLDAAALVVLILICALIVTYAFGDGSHFLANFAISACIGTISFSIIDGVRLWAWRGERRPPWVAFAALVGMGVVAGQVLGARLAGLLLGIELTTLHTLGSTRTSGMLLFTLLATGGASLYYAGRDRLIRAQAAAAQERARAEAVERQALQAQLQLLQAQIEPHMLFNTLANLQGLIALDPARAQRMLDQLIQFLRGTLSSSRAETTTLAQEFALQDAYLGLMAVRMGERLTYAFDLPDELRAARIPPMLLQPLVENAIAHGLEPTIAGGHVTVAARRDGGLLVLSVTDNGRGPDAGPGKEGTSVGLANTRERVRALFDARADVTLAAAPDGGAIASIVLPTDQP
ncbi:sensor histidine kinase [Pseudoduganella chitinolytica]|uniref:Histidine kinase n=1 Tax=Pseudoduganella chitinolytica TaxID=34070 RepID=A0ABY8BCC1_9BURK|nr:histidine kinase [Pseudoduganella chitinolytica]WEF33552.1 histidine kinase [Pseudoduganella chitinolytica]